MFSGKKYNADVSQINYDVSGDNIIQNVMIKTATYGTAKWAYIGGKEIMTYSKVLYYASSVLK